MGLPRIWFVFGLSLAGCSNAGLLDPAPFDPRQGTSETIEARTPQQLAYGTLTDARSGLSQISDYYSFVRNRHLRQQMALDAVLLATVAAAVANPLFDGARRSTLALGLGAAGLGVGRSYLGGTARAAAYHSGAVSFSCLATIAGQLQASDSGSAIAAAELATLMGRARARAGVEPLKSALARGESAQRQLDSAQAVLASAPAMLTVSGSAIIQGVTDRVMTGTMRFDTALTQARALGSFQPPPAASSVAAPVAVAAQLGQSGRGTANSDDEIAGDLSLAAARVAGLAKAISDIWEMRSTCALKE